LINIVLKELREEKVMGGRENIILSCLLTEVIRRIINCYIVPCITGGPRHPSMAFDVRGDGDTLRCALDIVDARMVHKLEAALLISECGSNGNYPTLLTKDMILVERIQGTQFTVPIHLEMSRADRFIVMLRGAVQREFSNDVIFRVLAR
jgi:hypothetical protein